MAPWEPTPLADGLRATAACVRQHGAMHGAMHGFEPTGYRAIEVHKGMPASWRAWLAQTDAVHPVAPPTAAAALSAASPTATTLPLSRSVGAGAPGAGASAGMLLLSFALGALAAFVVVAIAWRWQWRRFPGRAAAKRVR